MGTMPVPARIYLIAVVVAGSVGLMLSSVGSSPYIQGQLLSGLITVPIIAYATRYRIQVSYKAGIILAQPLAFAAMLVLGTATAFWATALGMTLGYLWQRRKWHNAAFNAAVQALAVGISGQIYYALLPADELLISIGDVLPLLLSWLTYYLLSFVLVSGVIALHRKQNFMAHCLGGMRQALRGETAFLMLAILVAIAGQHFGWMVISLSVIAIVGCTSWFHTPLVSPPILR